MMMKYLRVAPITPIRGLILSVVATRGMVVLIEARVLSGLTVRRRAPEPLCSPGSSFLRGDIWQHGWG
jgi:hypothetical protein